jgi:hypothetical protein
MDVVKPSPSGEVNFKLAGSSSSPIPKEAI